MVPTVLSKYTTDYAKSIALWLKYPTSEWYVLEGQGSKPTADHFFFFYFFY